MKLLRISENRKSETGFRMIVHISAAVCLSFGTMLMLNEIISMSSSKTVLFFVTLITILLCEIVPWKWFVPSALAGGLLITAAVTAFSARLANGFSIINNQVADAVGKHTGWIIPKYAVATEQLEGTDVTIALGMICIILSLAAEILVRQAHLLGIVIWILLLSVIATFTGGYTGYAGWTLIAGGILGVVACRIYCQENTAVCDHGFRMAGITYLFFAITAACGCLIFFRVCPAENDRVSSILSEIEQKTEDLVQKLRYEKKGLETLPKGEFSKANGRTETEGTALSVTMSEPQSCYLRGFVGDDYTSEGWNRLDTEIYYDNYDLFYWLHKADFYGNTQLTAAAEQVQEEEAQKDIIVSVKNELADSEYLYTPYELKPGSWDTKSLRISADESLASSRFFGDREYTYHMSGNLVTEFPSLAAKLFLKEQENQENIYIENESYYNSYVYDHYTDLSRDQESLMEQELGYAGDQKAGHIDYDSAIEKVEKYLNERIRYDETGKAAPKRKDFLKYFLTESRTGYDVHYASAATLMFRYYGIPARYVEGYLITPDDIKGKEKGDTIAVPNSNGHAWTEIYIDRLGWVPIEVTPKYRDIMDQPDLTKGLEAGTTQAVRNQPKENISLPTEEKTLPELLQETLVDLLKLVGILFLIFDIFVLLFVLTVLLKRIAACMRRRRMTNTNDNRKAILRIMKDTDALLRYCNPKLKNEEEVCEYIKKSTGTELAEQYGKAKRIWEKAAYSQHPISAEERKDVFDCCKQLKKQLMKQAGWYERWIICYIERLA